MDDDDVADRFHNNINLTNTTISNFIQSHFVSGDDTSIFAHVYDLVSGVRETLVTRQHIPEALNLIKTINIELARIMNHQAIQTKFAQPDDIIKSTQTTPMWKPFDIQKSIPFALQP
jgi:hypothetical protein